MWSSISRLVSPSGDVAPAVNRDGVFGSRVIVSNRCWSVSSTSASWSTEVSAPGPHTSTHCRQPVHFHGSTTAENRPPVPGCSFSIASKKGRVRATGKVASCATTASRLRITARWFGSSVLAAVAATSANDRSDESSR